MKIKNLFSDRTLSEYIVTTQRCKLKLGAGNKTHYIGRAKEVSSQTYLLAGFKAT